MIYLVIRKLIRRGYKFKKMNDNLRMMNLYKNISFVKRYYFKGV